MSAAKQSPEQSPSSHDGTPGMTAMTLIYNALFLLLYLYYFFMVWKRWPVS